MTNEQATTSQAHIRYQQTHLPSVDKSALATALVEHKQNDLPYTEDECLLFLEEMDGVSHDVAAGDGEPDVVAMAGRDWAGSTGDNGAHLPSAIPPVEGKQTAEGKQTVAVTLTEQKRNNFRDVPEKAAHTAVALPPPPWASRAMKPTNGIPLNIDTVARQGVEAEIPQWTVLIVDDEPEVHQVTILALQRFTYAGRGLRFLSAYSAKEAEALMAVELDIAVVLLDVVMETNQAGLDFVHYLRKELKNTRTRIILRTGQPGEAPEEAIIREYDINDYKTKTELTRQKLCTTILVSLRTYEQLLAFEANQRELEVLYHHLSERNSELQRAKDIAEAASQAKDEFLSLMNHELRTPLNVILMRAEILDNGVHGHLSVKQKKSLELIRNSGHHLLSIIDDILDLAGIETGKLSVSPRPISANDACIQSVDIVQNAADAKRIAIDLVLEPSPIWVYADERRLVQVLEKLLRNAVKFSKEDATIGLKLCGDRAAGVTRFTVWDEGIGISSMNITRLFQPFVQLEHSLTRRYEGAGLGLSIASKLVHLMGGSIAVDSTPGQGSQFTVTLALAPTTRESKSAKAQV